MSLQPFWRRCHSCRAVLFYDFVACLWRLLQMEINRQKMEETSDYKLPKVLQELVCDID
jgi:hypothetical protein